MPVELTVEQRQIQDAVKLIRQQADKNVWRKELREAISTGVEPALAEVKTRASSLAHVPTEARAAVAAKVKVAVMGGNDPKIRASVAQSAAPGFKNAGRAFNNPAGWRAPNWGRNAWHVQRSSDPGFWDESFRKHAEEIKDAVLAAVQNIADRIAGGV